MSEPTDIKRLRELHQLSLRTDAGYEIACEAFKIFPALLDELEQLRAERGNAVNLAAEYKAEHFQMGKEVEQLREFKKEAMALATNYALQEYYDDEGNPDELMAYSANRFLEKWEQSR